jgi:hypothetical protein
MLEHSATMGEASTRGSRDCKAGQERSQFCAVWAALEQDDFSSNRHLAPKLCFVGRPDAKLVPLLLDTL